MMTISRPRRDALEDIHPADTLVSDSSLQIHKTVHFCPSSHSACGTLLREPWQTHTKTSPRREVLSSDQKRGLSQQGW